MLIGFFSGGRQLISFTPFSGSTYSALWVVDTNRFYSEYNLILAQLSISNWNQPTKLIHLLEWNGTKKKICHGTLNDKTKWWNCIVFNLSNIEFRFQHECNPINSCTMHSSTKNHAHHQLQKRPAPKTKPSVVAQIQIAGDIILSENKSETARTNNIYH